MATIAIKIAVDNAAFVEGGGAEVARILRKLAEEYEDWGLNLRTTLRDINGNVVGSTALTGVNR